MNKIFYDIAFNILYHKTISMFTVSNITSSISKVIIDGTTYLISKDDIEMSNLDNIDEWEIVEIDKENKTYNIINIIKYKE
jgi:hypothetical protein